MPVFNVYRPGCLSGNFLLIHLDFRHIMSMKTLVQQNPYLSNPAKRLAMLTHSVRESSIFEGARCFHASGSRIRSSTHVLKKSAKG